VAVKSRPLAGKSVVVTRPAHQAQAFARLIKDAGGRPILFPAIEIRDVRDPWSVTRLVDRLDQYDVAIFVSPNAVERAMNLISARRKFPSRLQVATVGGASVRALERLGITGVVAPQGRYDSEGLLDLPEFAAMKGRRVVIFRGEGGRELLGETLNARGAVVEYAECYRRVKPELDTAPLLQAWLGKGIDAITVTSSEGLRNFAEMVGPTGRERLLGTPLFVPHPRIAEAAHELKVRKVIVTGPGDEGMLTGLTRYFKKA
jgi:uroporphyrinogen-III synthase